MRIVAVLVALLAAAPARPQSTGESPSRQGVQVGQPGPAVPSTNSSGPAEPATAEEAVSSAPVSGERGKASEPIIPLVNPSPTSPQLYGPGDVERQRRGPLPPRRRKESGPPLSPP